MSHKITSVRYLILNRNHQQPRTCPPIYQKVQSNWRWYCASRHCARQMANGMSQPQAASRHAYVAFPWPKMRSWCSEPFLVNWTNLVTKGRSSAISPQSLKITKCNPTVRFRTRPSGGLLRMCNVVSGSIKGSEFQKLIDQSSRKVLDRQS
jgi:hypothetical protein